MWKSAPKMGFVSCGVGLGAAIFANDFKAEAEGLGLRLGGSGYDDSYPAKASPPNKNMSSLWKYLFEPRQASVPEGSAPPRVNQLNPGRFRYGLSRADSATNRHQRAANPNNRNRSPAIV